MTSAAFTMTLKEAIELTGGTVELLDSGISKLTGGDIGLQYYKTFQSGYEETLNGKIIDHYWNREIGFETIDMFKMKMRQHMNNVMPYFNELYRSVQMTYDPLRTIDITTVSTSTSDQTQTAEGETIANSKTDSGSRTVNSTFPQVMLGGNKDYASAAVDVNGEGTADSTSNENSSSTSEINSDSDSHVTGYQGSPADLIAAFRANIINVDLQVIESLEPLFMQIWDHSDTYFNTEGYFVL